MKCNTMLMLAALMSSATLAAERAIVVPATVGFNIRKANNRQGPGLFELSPGKLTVVLADEAMAQGARSRPPAPAVAAQQTTLKIRTAP